ncbi:hypothetical protein [Kutzneria kofuensis]|uniref:N-acetyltransferase domain-containing protein n=1 Tax=Kutzneria kofuensis TaxID=103725 RepID=A0A7W9KNH0_9PSEU|nr:hypothetical protein [Kutzneria kofuensis]MBB5895799.1 hypothetical protein [Kutzneria kofuensis]
MTTTELPRWSSRPYSDADRDAVLALYTEPDFYFRTGDPDTRPEWEILSLLDEDTHVLLADGSVVGLYAVESEANNACHYSMQMRLTASAPLAWWQSAFQELLRANSWRREVVRLALRFDEFDSRGLAFARSAGLREEGTLGAVTVHEGRRYGYVSFAQIWEPIS